MLALHETTRRGLCQLGFVLLCVVPVCVILAAGWWARSDARRVQAEAELTARFGVVARIARWQWVRPETVRYTGIELVDPETQHTLARAETLDVAHYDEMVLITAQAPEVNLAAFEMLYEVVWRQLKTGLRGDTVSCSADRLAVKLEGEEPVLLDDVVAQLEFDETWAQAGTRFRLKGQPDDGLVKARVIRHREADNLGREFEMQTFNSRLPCVLIAPFWPAAAKLGPQAQFEGHFAARESTAGWNGGFHGVGALHNLNLATLVANHYPDQLTGLARVQIDRLLITDSRLEAIDGAVNATGGTIDQRLAMTLVRSLNLQGPPQVGAEFGSKHPLAQLAFQFALDQQGLLLYGLCQSQPPGSVLVDVFGSAIGEPQPNARQPLANVASILSPSNHVLMPISADSASLVNWLPLPSDRTATQPSESPKRR